LYELVITSDGSHTIYVPELNEHYHSIHGAIQESRHIFIESGLKSCNTDPVSIFEVGFGTGLNAMLTLIEGVRMHKTISYTSIEKFPLNGNIIRLLNHRDMAGDTGRMIFESIHKAPWNIKANISSIFNLEKIKGDIITDDVTGCFDLIYFDAFGPDKQPDMWTQAVFSKIAAVTKKGGIFLTYSAKGEVKRILRSCGFEVMLLPGPPGKRQIIRAIKI
jgi:tRNA U34 5-methylaminomethyl-2-thiouridine-forming methyltransferase MnmC